MILLISDKDALTDPSWFSVDSAFRSWVSALQCFSFFEITDLGLYQNPFAFFLFSSYYVAQVSGWRSHEWVDCPDPNAPRFFLLLPHWPHCCSPKWQLCRASGKKNTVPASFWKSDGKYVLFQDEINIIYMYFTFSLSVWLSYQRKPLILCFWNFFCFLINKTIWCGNFKHLEALMSYCWSYFFAENALEDKATGNSKLPNCGQTKRACFSTQSEFPFCLYPLPCMWIYMSTHIYTEITSVLKPLAVGFQDFPDAENTSKFGF